MQILLDTIKLYEKSIHGLINKTVAERLDRSKILQKWHAGHIFFSDEKMFVLQLQFNEQNYKMGSVTFRDKNNHSTILICVGSHGLGHHFQKRASSTELYTANSVQQW
jgi:hypothetical protein